MVSQDGGRFVCTIRFFDDIFPTPERVTLPRRNPFDEYDEKKFKERFRLSKSVVRRLLDEVTNSRHITIERRHVKWEGSGSDEVNINTKQAWRETD